MCICQSTFCSLFYLWTEVFFICFNLEIRSKMLPCCQWKPTSYTALQVATMQPIHHSQHAMILPTLNQPLHAVCTYRQDRRNVLFHSRNVQIYFDEFAPGTLLFNFRSWVSLTLVVKTRNRSKNLMLFHDHYKLIHDLCNMYTLL